MESQLGSGIVHFCVATGRVDLRQCWGLVWARFVVQIKVFSALFNTSESRADIPVSLWSEPEAELRKPKLKPPHRFPMESHNLPLKNERDNRKSDHLYTERGRCHCHKIVTITGNGLSDTLSSLRQCADKKGKEFQFISNSWSLLPMYLSLFYQISKKNITLNYINL